MNIITTNKYRKDKESLRKSSPQKWRKIQATLRKYLGMLCAGKNPVPYGPKHHHLPNFPLMDLHVAPDVILLYNISKGNLVLYRLASHPKLQFDSGKTSKLLYNINVR